MSTRALLALAATLALSACSGEAAPPVLQGYVEGDFLRIAPESTGRLTRLDVEDVASIKPAVAAGIGKFGRIDALVNNAGLTKDNLFMVMKDDQWDDVIAVNLTSTFMLCRAASRHMMRSKTGYGRIINIASVSGVFGNPGQGNYAASKAGMIGMTKSLAREVASRGITANCVAPGFIKTAMTDVLTDKQKGDIAQIIPSQRFGEPLDIAAGCLYLASNEGGYMTGQTLHINGGMAMV